jgi:hypothetical protein
MNGRSRFAALLGAGVLLSAAVGAVAAAAPTYTIAVTKTANPATVPVEGADVTFTVWVHNTGTGLFHAVTPTDEMVGCTLAGPSGDTGSDGVLSAGETWHYTCTVTDVVPDTINSVDVDACHDGGVCNVESHDATGSGEVTVGLCESNCDVVQTPAPTGGGGGNDNVPSAPNTDTFQGAGRSGPTDGAWLLVVALGALLGSLVVLRPSGRKHRS